MNSTIRNFRGSGPGWFGHTEDVALLPDVLETEHLHLRRWSPKQSDDMLGAVSTSFLARPRWMPWAQTPPSGEEMLGVLAHGEENFARDREWNYALYEQDSGELVGPAGLHRVDEPQCPEIGYGVRSR